MTEVPLSKAPNPQYNLDFYVMIKIYQKVNIRLQKVETMG